MKNNVLQAIILLLVGGFFIYWAQSHSPVAGLVEKLGNELSGSYTLSETWYYITLGIGAALGVMGVFKLLKK